MVAKPKLQLKWVFLGKAKSWLSWGKWWGWFAASWEKSELGADVGIMTTANDDSANVTTAASRFGLG